MKTEFIPIDYDYFDFEGKNYMKLVGQTKNNEKICVIDDYSPNFWLILELNAKQKDIDELIKKIKEITIEKGSRKTTILKIIQKKKKYLEKEYNVLQIFADNHKDLHSIANEIGDSKIILARREFDLPLFTKYIKEDGLKPLKWYEIEGDVLSEKDFNGLSKTLELELILKLKSKKEIKNDNFTPKVLAFDIESQIGEIGKGKIYMIGLYGEGFKKIITYNEVKDSQDYVEIVKNEKEMIQKFCEHVKNFSPDIVCGYFSDGYDLPFLSERAKKYKIKLSLGVDNSNIKFSRGAFPIARINGVVHVDLHRFISSVFSQYLSGESLSLNDVAEELIGEKKDDFDFHRLKTMTEKDWLDFFRYNLRDVEVTYKLFKKVWPDMSELTRIVKEPLFDITHDTMATNVENFLIHNLDRFDEIAEKKPLPEEIGRRRNLGKYEGAFVYEPTPGLYKDVVMFDFTSMYGSVIVSYNLSKATLLEEKGKDGEPIFKKEIGFFPTLLSEIIDLRKKYKKEFIKNKDNMSKARSNAYKLLANAAYGYLGFFGARYYSREAASSTTRLAKENILKVIEKIRKEGYGILYSDTDSIAFTRENKSKQDVKDYLKILNESLPGIMELDLEGFFKRGLFVSKRTTKTGAKKKYALLEEDDSLKIRGFETVRRDWCKLTRRLQSDIIHSILKTGSEKDACDILRDVIEKLKGRKVDLKDLIIKTQLRRPISEYTSIGPHVVAAQKMQENGSIISSGMLIEYFIGEATGKKIGDKVFLPGDKAPYDLDYYTNNQIIPAVENIFDVFGIKAEEIIDGQKQTGLFDFG